MEPVSEFPFRCKAFSFFRFPYDGGTVPVKLLSLTVKKVRFFWLPSWGGKGPESALPKRLRRTRLPP